LYLLSSKDRYTSNRTNTTTDMADLSSAFEGLGLAQNALPPVRHHSKHHLPGLASTPGRHATLLLPTKRPPTPPAAQTRDLPSDTCRPLLLPPHPRQTLHKPKLRSLLPAFHASRGIYDDDVLPATLARPQQPRDCVLQHQHRQRQLTRGLSHFPRDGDDKEARKRLFQGIGPHGSLLR
jgi:hypothetical protein